MVDEFARRFGVEVIDAFGVDRGRHRRSSRDASPRAGAMGVAGPTIRIVDEDGEECPPAELDADGRLAQRRGVRRRDRQHRRAPARSRATTTTTEATDRATRNGWYWSGDLGYLDDDRYLYFAGRTADWIRVDGENFPAGPIADAIVAHPDVVVAVAYGVPDVEAGDQVMAALVLRDGADLRSRRDGRAGSTTTPASDRSGGRSGSGWRPSCPPPGRTRWSRARWPARSSASTRSATDAAVACATRGADAYRPFGPTDEATLRAEFVAIGRERFWDL